MGECIDGLFPSSVLGNRGEGKYYLIGARKVNPFAAGG